MMWEVENVMTFGIRQPYAYLLWFHFAEIKFSCCLVVQLSYELLIGLKPMLINRSHFCALSSQQLFHFCFSNADVCLFGNGILLVAF